MDGPSDLPVNGQTVPSSGEWMNHPISSGRKGWSVMTFRHACCTLAIDNMNGADSRGRGEKRRRINERDRKARVREIPEERERQC